MLTIAELTIHRNESYGCRLDNYDSFTYNLVQYLGELGADVHGRAQRRGDGRRDRGAASPSASSSRRGRAGPRTPGVTMDVIRELGERDADSRRLPRASGDRRGVRRLGRARAVPMHGKTSTIEHDGRGVFSGLTGPFVASRYHSLVVAEEGLPAELEVTARTQGRRHRSWGCGTARWPVHGVQFHPESILTGEGRRILRNFLERPTGLSACFPH